jgi:hypothetical protein
MTARQNTAREIPQKLGFSRKGAAALVGNFSQEVGANLQSAYRPAKDLDHGSQGLPQWRLDRRHDFEDWCSKHSLNRDDMETQLMYVDVEIARNHKHIPEGQTTSLYDALHSQFPSQPASNLDELTARVCWEYEEPSKAAANLANRKKQAIATYNGLGADPVVHPAVPAGTAGVAAGAGLVAFLIHAGGWVIGGVLIIALIAGIIAAITAWKQAKTVATLDSAVADLTAKAHSAAVAKAAANAAIEDQQKKIDAAKTAVGKAI